MTHSFRVWRILPAALADHPYIPASHPEGRFHHADQVAAYASLSAEGARVAIQRYLGDGAARVIIAMRLEVERLADERGNRAASVVWQDDREAGVPSPTWAFSDAARRAGAQAMLYSSRSRPDLAHVVVFDPACLREACAPMPLGDAPDAVRRSASAPGRTALGAGPRPATLSGCAKSAPMGE